MAQQILRQVGYDSLSRRDRKARHLKIAAPLRAAFPRDRKKSPTSSPAATWTPWKPSPMTATPAEIRGQAITALIRAGESAERAGAPARPPPVTPPQRN